MGRFDQPAPQGHDVMFSIYKKISVGKLKMWVFHWPEQCGRINGTSRSSNLCDLQGRCGYGHTIRQLALEYAPRGLRIFSVAPGLIHTPAIEGLGADMDEFLKRVGDSHAQKRPGQPSEVAELVAFLCSERAPFMTGGPIFVDGGCMLRSSLGDAIRPFFVKEE